jgi:hypothetical protein
MAGRNHQPANHKPVLDLKPLFATFSFINVRLYAATPGADFNRIFQKIAASGQGDNGRFAKFLGC